MDANTVPSLPAVGDEIPVFCTSRQCAEHRDVSLPVAVSACANHSCPGAGQFRCRRCNRLFVCCTKCYSTDGAGILCFLIDQRNEKTSYSPHASIHFASHEHLAQFSVAGSHNVLTSAQAHRANHSAASSPMGGATTLRHGDDDMPLFDDNEEQSDALTVSCADDLLRQLSQQGFE